MENGAGGHQNENILCACQNKQQIELPVRNYQVVMVIKEESW